MGQEPIYGARTRYGANLWGWSQSMGPGPAMGLIYGAENVYGADLWGWSQSMGPGQSMGPIYGASLWGQEPLWGQSMGLGSTVGPIYGAGTRYGADLWGWGRCVGPECPIGVPFHPPPPPHFRPTDSLLLFGAPPPALPHSCCGAGGRGGELPPTPWGPTAPPHRWEPGGGTGRGCPIDLPHRSAREIAQVWLCPIGGTGGGSAL